MKKHLPEAAAVLACCLAAVCLFQIASLRGEIGSLRSNLSNQISRVDSSVQAIYSTVGSQLERGASLLAGKEFRYEGEPDLANRTARLRCTVTPKEFSPDRTGATLYWSGGEAAMTLEQGAFSAVLELPLFSESSVSRVTFSQDGTLRTEALDWYFSPRTELLPCFYASFDGSASGSGGSYHREGSLWLDIANPHGTGKLPDSVVLIEFLDGVEKGRTDLIPDDALGGGGDGNDDQRRYTVDVTCEVPNGSTHELWIEVTDEYGLRYRMLVDRWITDAQGNGSPDENGWIWQGNEPEIYDAKGNLLYRPDPMQ